MQLAADNLNAEIVEMLLARGADPNHQSSVDQRTPLHIAVEMAAIYASESATVADWSVPLLLLRYGARLDLQDVHGRTPIDVAMEQRHPEFADELRSRGR